MILSGFPWLLMRRQMLAILLSCLFGKSTLNLKWLKSEFKQTLCVGGIEDTYRVFKTSKHFHTIWLFEDTSLEEWLWTAVSNGSELRWMWLWGMKRWARLSCAHLLFILWCSQIIFISSHSQGPCRVSIWNSLVELAVVRSISLCQEHEQHLPLP